MSPAVKRAWVAAALLAALVLALDQVAKAIAESRIEIGEQIEVLGPLELTLTHNRGVAFGIAGGAGAPLVLVTLVALGVVLCLFARNPARPWMWVAVGLLVGGALGNLVDRIRYGEVIDFIEVHLGSYQHPTFNIADIAIVVGVGLMAIDMFTPRRRGGTAPAAKSEGAKAEGAKAKA